MNSGGAIDSGVIDGQRRDQQSMNGGGSNGHRRALRWETVTTVAQSQWATATVVAVATAQQTTMSATMVTVRQMTTTTTIATVQRTTTSTTMMAMTRRAMTMRTMTMASYCLFIIDLTEVRQRSA